MAVCTTYKTEERKCELTCEIPCEILKNRSLQKV